MDKIEIRVEGSLRRHAISVERLQNKVALIQRVFIQQKVLIAMEARVSKGLVFWYFRSKEELIIEVAIQSLPLGIIDSCLESDLTGEKYSCALGRTI